MGRRGFAKVFCVAMALAVVMGVAGAEEYSPNAVKNGWNLPGARDDFIRYINQMTGEVYADVMASSISVQREFRRALPSIYSYSQTAHYQNRADVGSEAAYASAGESVYAVCPTTMCSPGSSWVMWDVPWMMNETKKRKDGYLGYRTASSGFATGISRMLGESSAIGLAIGYDARKLDARDSYHQRNRADTLHLALYGGTNIGHLFIDGYAGWSRSWNRTEREVELNSPSTPLLDYYKSNYKDDVWSAGLKASYVWILCNDVRITPSVGVDISHVKMKKFNERVNIGGTNPNNGTYGVNGRNSSYTNVAMPIMVAVNKTFGCNFLMFKGAQSLWTPEVRAGWTPNFGSKHARAKMVWADGTGGKHSPLSSTLADSYGTVGAGLKMKLADKYIFAVEYDYTFASKYSAHSVTAMYGVSF